MRRISTTTKVTDKFGAGKHGFTNGDAVGGVPATDLEDVWFDHTQEEICTPIEAAGLTLDPNNRGQLLEAIQILSAPIVGLVRNAKMSVTAASASATFTADQVVVASAAGGKHYRLSGFNKTINLATTGAGGMDTGSAPNSGYVALYAIYNPTTGASALLACNATAAAQPEVYGGANMPSGYTASALVSVVPTNASGQFLQMFQIGRRVAIPTAQVLSTNAVVATPASLNLAGALPRNAVSASGYVGGFSNAPNASITVDVYSTSAPVGRQPWQLFQETASQGNVAGFRDVLIATAQTIYYTTGANVGTPIFTIFVTGYKF